MTDCCEPDRYAFFQGYATWKAGRLLKRIADYAGSTDRDQLGILERTYNDRRFAQLYDESLKLIRKIDPAGPGVKERNLESRLEIGLAVVKNNDRCLYEEGKLQIERLRKAREER